VGSSLYCGDIWGHLGTPGDIEENKISGELTYGEIILYPERIYVHVDHSLNV